MIHTFFGVVFHEVLYLRSLGMVSHLNAVVLKDNKDFCQMPKDWNTLTEDVGKIKGSFFPEHALQNIELV